MLLMGKLTISTGPFSSSQTVNVLPEGSFSNTNYTTPYFFWLSTDGDVWLINDGWLISSGIKIHGPWMISNGAEGTFYGGWDE